MFNHRHGPPALSTCNFLGVAILILIVVGSHNVSSDTFNSEFVKEKICIGTNDHLFSPSDKDHHYRNLRDRYTNCTYVDGNLEITWLDETFDLSFLQHIREVTGYILINHVDVRKVVLPRLQIIRGRTLFKSSSHEPEFALFVMMCKMYNLELPALRDILNGSVAMFNNYNLCHIKTINWNEIITSPKGRYVYVYDRDVFQFPERVCQCDESCEQGCCWGEGPENCQKFSKINCSPQCSQGRCFGPNPRECCHLFCAGGCTGPKQSDCFACKNFYNDGVCTQECPSMEEYNPTTYLWEANPEGKYVYGVNCVKKCPQHLLKDEGACVRSCPSRKKEVNGECVPCDGLCPKTCKTTEKTIIHSGNIDSFKDCTVIDGSITILEQSFNGFHDYVNFSFGKRYEKMHPDKLEVFKSLKTITGFLDIQAYHKDFRNLSYFRNLELIEGRMLTSNRLASLYIVKTSLESFELNSLKMIQFGSIIIVENKNLCYTQSINWTRIQKSVEHIKENNLSNNRDESECVKDGFVCDEQCSDEGCWGSGPAQCLSCKNVILGNNCFENCTARGIYQTNKYTCKLCHEECDSSCTGPNADQCFKCKNIQDGPFCVSKCPSLKYNDNGQCKHCHENCADGCDGPGYDVGANGCHSCEKAIINENVPERCLFKNEQCPDGYYEWVNLQEQGALKPFAGKIVCRKCHPRCKRCTGYGFHEQVCLECAKYKRGEQCEDECPVDHFVETGTQLCIPCFPECLGCFGQFANQCYKCRNYKIYTADPISNNTMFFNCTEVCPPEYPHKIFPPNSESYCSITKDLGYQMNSKVQNAILAGVVFVIVVIVVIALVILYLRRQRRKEKENVVKMIMALTDLDDNVSLRPTEVKPNLAKLRIIKEEEMRKGGILGSGAFGNVFKGVWVPEGENVKIPVAIKVLHNDTGMNMSKEFLDEAHIMASVEHPNLLQLLAVCMTSQMMLVTQLMPLGCLLKFVRRYKNKIGSKSLLNWCTQIARGMAYLEERRLVHRDLAARNVLVQTSNCVKITDFGLAKLLDVNEEQCKAAGGKMPIKWLALECIQHRVFTHKSDVWAFGVTIWEVLTYGGRPYESVSAQNVPELLEKGKRLPQPPICTIDVYMIMIKCWMLDAESRPSFKELAEDFAKMSRDPGRYLAIKGDKYMKLPSYIMQDEKEIIRNLASAMDRPEALMDADGYLQPKSRTPLLPGISASSTPGSSPNTPVKSCWPNNRPLAADSPTPQNQQNWNRKLLRYGNNQGNGNASHEAEMSCQPTFYVHSNIHGHCGHAVAVSAKRYCSDSLKLVCKDCDVTDDCFDAKVNSAHQQAQVGDLKLDLPFDEDDYLVPSPQLSDNTTQYMNLIGKSKLTESDPMRLNNNFRKYPGYLTIQGKTLLDNPEYIMSQDDGPLTPQTFDISTPDLEKVLTNGIFVFESQVRQQSSEEKSDHEYYNDFDRLERELEERLKC